MSLEDCIKIKRQLTDPADRAVFDREFDDAVKGGMPREDAWKYAAEMTMEQLLEERNALAAQIRDKGGNVEDVSIEQLLTPPKREIRAPEITYGVRPIPRKAGYTVQDQRDAQRDLFDEPDLPPAEAQDQAADTFNTLYAHRKVGEIRSGFEAITSPDEAAHVMASIRKRARENFLVTVVGDGGKILNVIRHSTGTRDGASVYPIDVVGAIAATDGAKGFWLAHNHPSGTLQASNADQRITDTIVKATEGLGIKYEGHVIIGDTSYTTVDGTYTAKIPPAARTNVHPITERILVRRKKTDMAEITSPAQSIALVRSLEAQRGMVLLDNRNKSLGVMVFSEEEMGALKANDQVRRIWRTVDATNATAVIPFDKTQYPNEDALTNLGNFLTRIPDLRHLDTIMQFSDGLGAWSNTGRDLGMNRHFFSRPTLEPAFYSELAKQFDGLTMKAASADQWIASIRNMTQRGVKQAEIDYSGIIDWIDQLGLTYGRDRLPKSWIQSYLEAQEVKLETREFMGKRALRDSVYVQDLALEIFEEQASQFAIRRAHQEAIDSGISPTLRDGTENEAYWDFTAAREAELLDQRMADVGQRDATSWRRAEIDALDKAIQAGVNDQNETMLAQYEAEHLIYAPAGYENYGELVITHRNPQHAPVHSQHFDWMENQVGWVRYTWHTTESGEKVFRIQEIQDDVRQRGRKHGYAGETYNVVYLEPEERYDEDRPWAVTFRGKLTHRAYRKKAAAAITADQLTEQLKYTGVPNVPFQKVWPQVVMKRAIKYAVDNGANWIQWTGGDIQNKRYEIGQQIDAIDYQKIGEMYDVSVWAGGDEVFEQSGMDIYDIKAELGDEIAQRINEGAGKKMPQNYLIFKDEGKWHIRDNDESGHDLSTTFDTYDEAMDHLLKGQQNDPEMLVPFRYYNHIRGRELNDRLIGGAGMIGFYDNMLPKMTSQIVKRYGVKIDDFTDTEGRGTRYVARESGARGRWRVWDTIDQEFVNLPYLDKRYAEIEAMRLNGGVELDAMFIGLVTRDGMWAAEFDSRMNDSHPWGPNFWGMEGTRRGIEKALEEGFGTNEEQSGRLWTFEITDALRAAATKGFPMFGRRGRGGKHTKATVDKWLKEPISRLKNVNVQVIDTIAELQAKYPYNDIPSDIAGVYMESSYGQENDIVWIVAENIRSKRHAHTTFAHEVVGHLGLMRMLGPVRYKALLQEIMQLKAEGFFGDNEISELIEQLKQTYVDENGKYTLNAEFEAEEVLAHIAERRPRVGRWAELYNKLLELLRKFFEKLGLVELTRVKTARGNETIEDLLEAATKYVQGKETGRYSGYDIDGTPNYAKHSRPSRTDIERTPNWTVYDSSTVAHAGKTFSMARVDKGNKIVLMDAAYLEDLLTDAMVGPGPQYQNQISNRIEQFKEYWATHSDIEVGDLYVSPQGYASFSNGRHRTRVMIEQGMQQIPVSMNDESIEALRTLARGEAGPRNRAAGIMQQRALFARDPWLEQPDPPIEPGYEQIPDDYDREAVPRMVARDSWQALAESPHLFKWETSESKDLNEIMRVTTAGAARGEWLSEPWDKYVNEYNAPEEVAERQWHGMMDRFDADGKWLEVMHFDVLEAGDSVWVNFATISPGGGGSMLYNAVANYAYNTGKVFVGDPHGLTPLAFHRRLENMISTALKFGTTRHIYPHARQMSAQAWADITRFGAPPTPEELDRMTPLTVGYLEGWRAGDDPQSTADNIELMLDLSYRNYYEFLRGDDATGTPPLATFEFDPRAQQFRSIVTGEPLTRNEILRLAESPGGKQIGAGESSIKRALLTGFFRDAVLTGEVSGTLPGFLAQYANEPLPQQLKQLYYSRPAKGLGQNQRKGNLTLLKKEYPEIHAAVQAQLKKLPKAEAKFIRDNLKAHKGTGWAASAVKSLAIREVFDGLLTGQNMDAVAGHEFWENDPLTRYRMLTAVSKGEAGVKAFLRGYTFIGTNRKAENDVSGSFLNCDPSSACAEHCYAVSANGRHVELLKAEFTEMAAEMFPDEVAEKIAYDYKHSPAGLAGLSLRINDKGDLSPVQVQLIKRLNGHGVPLQVFSKRPELLRELSDINLKMLSIDATNFDMARANPDLRLAVTLTDNFTQEMVREVNDRVSVYLPVNLRGTVWNTEVLKQKYPDTFRDMKKALCPVEAGLVTTRKGIQFVDILEGVADGNWTCTACDILGAVGCFHKDRKTEARKAAMGLFEIEVNEAETEARIGLQRAESEIRKLQAAGAIDERTAENTLAQLREGLRVPREESIPDPEADGSEISEPKEPRYSRSGEGDRRPAYGQTGLFDEEQPAGASPKSRKGLTHKQATQRIPEIQGAIEDLMNGSIAKSDYERVVNEHKPVDPYDYVPVPATETEMRNALASNKVDRIGAPARELEAGAPVGLRLDIPAYTNHGVWVVTVHQQRAGFEAGKVVGYDSVAHIKNATFGSRESAAQKVAQGGPKSTMATIKGEWVPTATDDANRLAIAVLAREDWTQVGFDPERHSYFWDRYSMAPVVAADEVVQIGPLVLARNPKYAPKSDFRYSRKTKKPRTKEEGATYRIAQAVREAYGAPANVVKRQIWGILSLRQLAEQVRPILPIIYDDFLSYYQRMETVRNVYKSRAGTIAGRRRKLSPKENDQLSVVQHESTIAGVDGDVPYEALIDPIDAERQIKVIKQQVFGRSGEDKARLIEKWKKLEALVGQEMNRRKARKRIVEMFHELNEEQKAIYRLERDYHVELRQEQKQALLERIAEAFVDEAIKGDMMVRLQAQFEAAEVTPPYFPLARFGEYWVHSEIDGEQYFDMFETEGEWIRHHDDVADGRGKILGAGKKQSEIHEKKEVNPQFVGKVNEILSGLGDHPQILDVRDRIYQLYLESLPELSARKHAIHRSKMRGFYRDHLRAFAHSAQHGSNMLARLKYGHRMQRVVDDANLALAMANRPSEYQRIELELEAYQGFLIEKIDEMSEEQIKREVRRLRKAAEREASLQMDIDTEEGAARLYDRWQLYLKIKRQVSARKDFAVPTPKLPIDAVQDRIDRRIMLLTMADNINKQKNPLKTRRMMSDALAELQRSHNDIVNPNVAPWANNLNALGFVWYLGVSPAAGLVNLAQTPAVALPVAAARFGWGPVSKHMGMITTQIGRQLKRDEGVPYAGIEKMLQDEGEIAAYKRWHDEGMLDKTLAHDLQGISEEGIYTGQLKHRIMGVASFIFHQAERMNREITALAVYRAARDRGLKPRAAAIAAEEIVWKTHFDYTQGNRPRVMRGNVMRVITQFKQYSQNITYLYGRTFQQAFGPRTKETPEVRSEARKMLFNMLLMQSMFAGLLGWPLVELAVEIFQMFGFDDDDDPQDYKGNIQQWTHDKFGHFGSEAILKGLPNAMFNVDMHSRLTLSDLWWRTSDRELEGSPRREELVKAAGGPVASILIDVHRGAEQFGRAQSFWEYSRALETMSPKMLKDALKGARYGAEGLKGFTGKDILPKEEISPWVIAQRVSGFTSANVEQAYEARGAVERLKQRREARKDELRDRFEALVERNLKGDDVMGQLVEAEMAIGRWNKKNPRNPILADTIAANIKRRFRENQTQQYGIRRDRTVDDLLERFTFGAP